MKQFTRIGVGIAWMSLASSVGCGGVDAGSIAGNDGGGDDGSLSVADSDASLPGSEAATSDAGLPGLDAATSDESLISVVKTGCEALCAAEVDAGCSAQTTLPQCIIGCALLAGNPSCATQTSAFFSCTQGAVVSCDSSGNPSFPDCDIDYLAAEACVLASATNPSVSAPCTQYCANVASAHCPNDADGGCVGGCEGVEVLVASCSPSWSSYVTCAETASMTCGSDGKATASACLAQSLAFLACVTQNLSTLLGDGG
jgi:hypothetical protein